MTCAHVVDVALKKVAGVKTVEVSLNKGLAIVTLAPGNSVLVPQLWELIHKNGYTPKVTTVSIRGDLAKVDGKLQLRVSGTKETIALTAGPKSFAAYNDAQNRVGQNVVILGVMIPAKDLKAPVPLQVMQVK